MSTTDFDAWLDEADLENYEEVYCLYRSVADCDEMGSFKTQVAKGTDNGWIVSARHCADTLHLCSETAKNAFLTKLEKKYCGELDMESWYAIEYANAKDD